MAKGLSTQVGSLVPEEIYEKMMCHIGTEYNIGEPNLGPFLCPGIFGYISLTWCLAYKIIMLARLTRTCSGPTAGRIINQAGLA
jgi:hypothetical protein